MAGYSERALFEKLGMKPQSQWKLIQAPNYYFDILGDVEQVSFESKGQEFDGIHLFTNNIKDLEDRLNALRHMIKKEGMIWVSWYKKSAKIPSELSEDNIRDTAIGLGLVDIKVCEVNEKWSGLKLVWRKENR